MYKQLKILNAFNQEEKPKKENYCGSLTNNWYITFNWRDSSTSSTCSIKTDNLSRQEFDSNYQTVFINTSTTDNNEWEYMNNDLQYFRQKVIEGLRVPNEWIGENKTSSLTTEIKMKYQVFWQRYWNMKD